MYINSTIANTTLSAISNSTEIPDNLEITVLGWQGFWELLPQEWTRQIEVYLMMWMYATVKDLIMFKLRLGYRGYKRFQRYRESDVGDDFLNYNDPSKLRERAIELEEIFANIENEITANVKDTLTTDQFEKFKKLKVTYNDQIVFDQNQTTTSEDDDDKNKSWLSRGKKQELVIPSTQAITRLVKYRDILQYSGSISVENGKYKTRFKLEPLFQPSNQVAFEDMETILNDLRDKVPVIDVENESQSIYDHLAVGHSLS